MTRWANDPDAAADALMRRSLDDVGLHGRILVANQHGALPVALSERGVAFSLWNRRLHRGLPVAPWPSGGPFDLAFLRLPKAKDEQEMAAHAALSVLAPGGRLILYGGNDEGIRSAATMLAQQCGSAETIAARGHGRIIAAARPQDTSRLRASLAAWRSVMSLDIAGATHEWVSYPGIFAAGRLDEGTALLLTALPPLSASARVLDYGCGAGAIGAAVLARCGSVSLDMLDNDTVALEAARENVPAACLVLGTRVADAGRTYDAILSNPPLHRGIAEDHALLEELIAEAPAHLSDGILQLVVQRRVPLDRILAKHFDGATVMAESARYRVWRARRG